MEHIYVLLNGITSAASTQLCQLQLKGGMDGVEGNRSINMYGVSTISRQENIIANKHLAKMPNY